jgi:hypothetical protein
MTRKEEKREKDIEYVERQIASGLKKGDTVKIGHRQEDCEEGWQGGWVDSMTEAYGQFGTITAVFSEPGNAGIIVKLESGRSWIFPYFSLLKVEKY